ncbi:MAG: hypothetical protein ACRDD1_19390 [Planctomycetia bacterium]
MQTQLAVMALWQAQDLGGDVEGSLRRVRQRMAYAQTKTGGWNWHTLADEGDGVWETTPGLIRQRSHPHVDSADTSGGRLKNRLPAKRFLVNPAAVSADNYAIANAALLFTPRPHSVLRKKCSARRQLRLVWISDLAIAHRVFETDLRVGLTEEG